MSDNSEIEDKSGGSEQPEKKSNAENRKSKDRRKFSYGHPGQERRSGRDRRDNDKGQK